MASIGPVERPSADHQGEGPRSRYRRITRAFRFGLWRVSMYLPYSERDLLGVQIILDIWRKRGFIGELDESTAANGVISITTENWKAKDGSFVTFELHKVSGGRGIFGGQKVSWVARLLTHPDSSRIGHVIHGCYQSGTQPHALDRAIADVGTYLSKSTIADYLND